MEVRTRTARRRPLRRAALLGAALLGLAVGVAAPATATPAQIASELAAARDHTVRAGDLLVSSRAQRAQARLAAKAAAAEAEQRRARLDAEVAATDHAHAALDHARAPLQSLSIAAYTLASDGELARQVTGIGGPEYGRRMVGTATERTLERIDEVQGAVDEAEERLREAAADSEAADRTAADALAALDGAEQAERDATAAFEAALAGYEVAWGRATVDATDLPRQALDAYLRGAATAPCPVPWPVLAGIGRVESHHGGGRLDPGGRAVFYGPLLDGSLAGTAVVTDSDGGALDGDATFDRAIGPMQFLPGTWRTMARDGDGDGVADPFDIDDAVAAAAAYLCRSGVDTDVRGAVLAYNPSGYYADTVLAHADGYWAALGDDGAGQDAPLSPGALRTHYAG